MIVQNHQTHLDALVTLERSSLYLWKHSLALLPLTPSAIFIQRSLVDSELETSFIPFSISFCYSLDHKAFSYKLCADSVLFSYSLAAAVALAAAAAAFSLAYFFLVNSRAFRRSFSSFFCFSSASRLYISSFSWWSFSAYLLA